MNTFLKTHLRVGMIVHITFLKMMRCHLNFNNKVNKAFYDINYVSKYIWFINNVCSYYHDYLHTKLEDYQ